MEDNTSASSSSFSLATMESVCVSTWCEKYMNCKRSAYNAPDGYRMAVSYASTGSGCASSNQATTTFKCGKAGKYAMYVPKG